MVMLLVETLDIDDLWDAVIRTVEGDESEEEDEKLERVQGKIAKEIDADVRAALRVSL